MRTDTHTNRRTSKFWGLLHKSPSGKNILQYLPEEMVNHFFAQKHKKEQLLISSGDHFFGPKSYNFKSSFIIFLHSFSTRIFSYSFSRSTFEKFQYLFKPRLLDFGFTFPRMPMEFSHRALYYAVHDTLQRLPPFCFIRIYEFELEAALLGLLHTYQSVPSAKCEPTLLDYHMSTHTTCF